MAELRQMEFYAARNAGIIVAFHSTSSRHIATVHREAYYVWTDCSCGGKWSLSNKKATDEELSALFNAHLCYAERAPLTTL